MLIIWRLAVLAAVLATVAGNPFRRESEEVMLPMRDGVMLHTAIHFPRCGASSPRSLTEALTATAT